MRPSKRLLMMLAAWSLLGLAVSLLPNSWSKYLSYIWYFYGSIIAYLTIWDGFKVMTVKPINVTRLLPKIIALGVNTDINLTISHNSSFPLFLTVYDHYPNTASATQLPVDLILAPAGQQQARASLKYSLCFYQRGLAQFKSTQILVSTPINLWQHTQWCGESCAVKVYPNFMAIGGDTLMALDQRLSMLGILSKQRRGTGLDFHQLREYRQGDEPRLIDWKATAKRKELITKEYQDERDQQVIFMLDCGRRMLTKDGNISHFDASLNAMLLLAYVALKQGDAVGFTNFSAETNYWLACKKGSQFINTILNTVYHLDATQQASDYSQAAQQLMLKQKRRALVILLTNMRDEHSIELIPAIKLLKKRHLVMVANLRETIIDSQTNSPITDFNKALAYLGAFEYTYHRKATQDALVANGVLSIDTTPNNLSSALVNRYLDVKRSGLL